MSVLVVVVIVGVVAAIALATLSDPPQPATPRTTAPRAPEPAPQPEAEAEAEAEAELDPVWADDLPAFEPAFPTAVTSEPDDRRWRHRLRSAGLLGLAVAVLGAVTAAALGGTALVGYRFLDRALG